MQECITFFQFLWANETGGNQPAELEGAKRPFKALKDDGVYIKTFVSDRHRGITKWIRETQKDTCHFYEI